MNFDKSILHSFQSWKLNNATLNNGVMTIKPNGNVQCIVYPRDKDESKIRESYQVIVTQGNKRGKLSFTFNNYLTEHENLKLTSIVIYSDNNINKVLKTEANITKQTVVIIENLSENDIEITNIELKPLSNVPIDIELELNKYTTHIFKYSNPDTVIIDQEKKVIANLNVELQETSNLLLQILINGVSSVNSTLNLYITVNTKELEYSPIILDVNEGNFLVGIPGNVMNMSEGENVVKVYAALNEGSMNVDINKIQVTLSGQNMMVIYGEDIWFGPSYDNNFDICEHEIFIHENNDISFIEDGKLKVRCIENCITNMTLLNQLKYGNVYQFTFNINKIKKYESVSIECVQTKLTSGVVIAGTVLAIVAGLAVGTGIALNGVDNIYDTGRLFHNYVENNDDLTWEGVETTFSSASALADGNILINEDILNICKGFFDETFGTKNDANTSNVPLFINPDGKTFRYFCEWYRSNGHTIFSNNYLYGEKWTIYYGPNDYYSNIYGEDHYGQEGKWFGLMGSEMYSNYPKPSKWSYGWIYRDKPRYAGNVKLLLDLPYTPGDYDWDSNINDKLDENNGLILPLPGDLGNLVGQPSDDFWNNSDDLLGGNDIIFPEIDNPSIDIDDEHISFPSEPPVLFDAYLYEYEGKYYTENDKGELIETTTHELNDNLFLNEGVYSINSRLLKPNMKVLYFKVENKDVVPQIKYSGVYEGTTITMDWDLQSEQGKTFNVWGDIYSDDNVRFLLSNNKGQSWLTFNGYEVVSCDINNIKDNGMTYDVFTSLNASQLQSFKGGTNSLRIAIYIEQYSVNGKTNIDHIRLRY